MRDPDNLNLEALPDARKALRRLDVTIHVGELDVVDGVSSVEIGLDALALTLADVFTFPQAKGAREPGIDEVLAYLVSVGRVQGTTRETARSLAADIKRARYEPLDDAIVEEMEDRRHELYDALVALLDSIDEASEHG